MKQDIDENTPSTDSSAEKTTKKEYHSPLLRDLGNINQITLATPGGGLDGGFLS